MKPAEGFKKKQHTKYMAKKVLMIWSLTLLLCLGISSCEKQAEDVRFQEMADFHAESFGLYQVESDSVSRFSQKVDAFVVLHPTAADDPLYPEIQQNIQNNWLRMTISVDTTWAGENYYEY